MTSLDWTQTSRLIKFATIWSPNFSFSCGRAMREDLQSHFTTKTQLPHHPVPCPLKQSNVTTLCQTKSTEGFSKEEYLIKFLHWNSQTTNTTKFDQDQPKPFVPWLEQYYPMEWCIWWFPYSCNIQCLLGRINVPEFEW